MAKNKNVTTKAGDTAFLHNNLSFSAREQYKMLRTNLNFVLPEDAAKTPIIGVTSSIRGEGKSITSINLAFSLADDGKKVLLIEADLRLPSVCQKMNCKTKVGLTDVLCNNDANQQVNILKVGEDVKLYVLGAGKIPPNPSELLGSKKMEKLLHAMSEEFDIIILDLPPVNIVTDALAVSHLLTGMILVVRNDYVTKHELDDCVRQLNLAGAKVLGTVMNCATDASKSYGRYRYIYKNRYDYKYGYYRKNSYK